QDVAVLAEADVDLVAEVQGARRLRADAVPLEAGLGEDEHLRRRRHGQLTQQGGQVAEVVLEAQRRLARVETLLQAGDRVVRGRLAVADGWRLDVRRRNRRQQADGPCHDHDGGDDTVPK